jgi:hypothetical protein
MSAINKKNLPIKAFNIRRVKIKEILMRVCPLNKRALEKKVVEMFIKCGTRYKDKKKAQINAKTTINPVLYPLKKERINNTNIIKSIKFIN